MVGEVQFARHPQKTQLKLFTPPFRSVLKRHSTITKAVKDGRDFN
jgi:hypothetical protein